MDLPDTSLNAAAGNYKTIVLADFNRLAGSSEQIATLQNRLTTFLGRSVVGGVLVNVGTDARVAAANAQADNPANVSCPEAKYLVAVSI
jgi:hypothetical protein